MNLTAEQLQAKLDRNEKIKQDHIEGMSRSELAKKYELSGQAIYGICRYTAKNVNREEPELTEFQKRMILKYKNFDLANEYGKSLSIRSGDVQIDAQAKRYFNNYSQAIWG